MLSQALLNKLVYRSMFVRRFIKYHFKEDPLLAFSCSHHAANPADLVTVRQREAWLHSYPALGPQTPLYTVSCTAGELLAKVNGVSSRPFWVSREGCLETWAAWENAA